MPIEEAVNFLKDVPPFQFLNETVLKSIAGSLSMEFYPKDTLILKQDSSPSKTLRIIKKGGVKVFKITEDGEEVIVDYRGESDSFGFLSLIGKDRQATNVVAIDDTICYLLSKEKVLKLLETNPHFIEYFLKLHFTKYIHETYSEMQTKSQGLGSSDRILFRTQIGDIARKEVVTVNEEVSIHEAAQVMAKSKISSLIILDENNLPVGIVTDRDLRVKVVAKGKDTNEPVKSIMTLPLMKIDARDYCFEAVLKMMRYNIHHLLVIKDGNIKSVITNHDIMLLQGSSPMSLAKDIESQLTIDGLVLVSRKINKIIGLLLKEGAKADNITKVITEINGRLISKIMEIAEKKYGQPPVQYCLIGFGSEGRKEQTFKTDQDNGIIYANPSTSTEAEEAKNYFSDFTSFVTESLIKCGFPPCPAGYMASNPLWCQPLKVWKKYFSEWIHTPTADAMLKSLIIFDFRPLYGDFELAEQLRNFLFTMLEGERVFHGHMANKIIQNRPPIGFLRSFVVEKSGDHKDKLNLKIKGVAPLVDIVRLFSLERGIKETSTLERINALKDKHTIVKEYADELDHAFDFIMLLRIHHQFEQIEAGKEPDNFINPNALSNLEKKTIKDAFHLISRIQDLIIERYRNMIL